MAIAHKSAISVGLLYIPVGLYKTTKDISVSFNQLCKDTHERVRQKKICPSCNKEVTSDEIIKGYEYEKGKYVTFTEDELEKIKTKKDKTIHIEHFAMLSDVDQIFYEKKLLCCPRTWSGKSIRTIKTGNVSPGKSGNCKNRPGYNRKSYRIISNKRRNHCKNSLLSAEIQAVPVASAKVEVSDPEVEMAKTMIDSMTSAFDPGLYHDEYQEKLRQAIESKIAGKEIVNVDKESPNNIIDLMEAMKKTVEMTKSNKGLA